MEAIIYRPQWHIDMWYEQLLEDVNSMIAQWERGRFNLNLSDSCSHYGGCMFAQLCDTNEPQNWHSMYTIKKWNPLTRTLEKETTQWNSDHTISLGSR